MPLMSLRKRRGKIVATVGPASASPPMLRMLHEIGVDVFRLNFSHGDHAGHGKVVDAIRGVEKETGRPIAIIADLQGPKLRVGPFEGGEMTLKYAETVRIEASDGLGGDGVIRMPHPELFPALSEGSVLKLDDGKLQLTVTEHGADSLTARVDAPGVLKDRKGVNIVGVKLPISALTEKDIADLDFALQKNVDYVALSFVQRPEDVEEARARIEGRAGLIVKLEKPSAIEELEPIIALADAAMVARGDLGVEIPPEEVPVVQRRIISTCRRAGKPVIVATHMLESMIDAPTPTRAEASDVANAIYQGADAVMLSAETAVGRHPQSAVAIMDRIIGAVEADPQFWVDLDRRPAFPDDTTSDAIAQAARQVAGVLGCKAIAAFTKTGSTGRRVSRERPACPILALTPDPRAARRLVLSWGVHSILAEDASGFDDFIEGGRAAAREQLSLPEGERIVITGGYPFGVPGKTNTLKITRL